MMKRIRRNHGRLMAMVIAVAALALPGLADRAGLLAAALQDPDTWRGLAVAPEHRCAPYNRADYPYPQSIEARIVGAQGGVIYGPYSGRLFQSTFETDIEHIVAVSEAHDSGLCDVDAETRRRFATDLLNLTLAGPAASTNVQESLRKAKRRATRPREKRVPSGGVSTPQQEAQMFDHIHSSTESNDTQPIPAAQAMPIPASPHRFPTPARCWPRSECRPTRSARFSAPGPTPVRTAE